MDYHALKTLESVIRNQNFERAARELFITQSAVSQRLNQLEADFGQRLLIRELPYRSTELGEKLLSHYRRVKSLEQEIDVYSSKTMESRPTIRVAMNVDTLELWFQKVLLHPEIAKMINLEITIDDEKYTLDYLKSGRVDVSIGNVKTQISNHDCTRLGSMTHVLVSNPEFKKKYVPKNMAEFNFSQFPGIVYNDRDDLHTAYLKERFNFTGSYPKSSIPSIAGIKAALISGFGYGLHPLMYIQKELRSKELVLLDKKESIQRELYLHHWNYQTPALKRLISVIQSAAKDIV